MSGFLEDIRSGLRNMRLNPGFSSVVVIILALGLGVNTTIFGALHALLFAPMPYKDAGQLVYVMAAGEHPRGSGPGSYPDFRDWRDQNHVFDEMSGFAYEALNLAGGGEPERLSGVRVSRAPISPLVTFVPCVLRQKPGWKKL